MTTVAGYNAILNAALSDKAIDSEKIPWVPQGDSGRVWFKPLRFDLATGRWINLIRMSGGASTTRTASKWSKYGSARLKRSTKSSLTKSNALTFRISIPLYQRSHPFPTRLGRGGWCAIERSFHYGIWPNARIDETGITKGNDFLGVCLDDNFVYNDWCDQRTGNTEIFANKAPMTPLTKPTTRLSTRSCETGISMPLSERDLG